MKHATMLSITMLQNVKVIRTPLFLFRDGILKEPLLLEEYTSKRKICVGCCSRSYVAVLLSQIVTQFLYSVSNPQLEQ